MSAHKHRSAELRALVLEGMSNEKVRVIALLERLVPDEDPYRVYRRVCRDLLKRGLVRRARHYVGIGWGGCGHYKRNRSHRAGGIGRTYCVPVKNLPVRPEHRKEKRRPSRPRSCPIAH